MWWKKSEGKENKPVLREAINGYFAKLILVKILAISAMWLVIVFYYKILSMIWIIIRVIWTVNNLRIVFHDGAMATLCVNGGSYTRRINCFCFLFRKTFKNFLTIFFSFSLLLNKGRPKKGPWRTSPQRWRPKSAELSLPSWKSSMLTSTMNCRHTSW